MPGRQLCFTPGQPKPLGHVLGTAAAKTLCGALNNALEAISVSPSLDTKMPLSLTPCYGAPGLTPILPVSKQIIFKRIYPMSSRKCLAANNRNLSSGHANSSISKGPNYNSMTIFQVSFLVSST